MFEWWGTGYATVQLLLGAMTLVGAGVSALTQAAAARKDTAVGGHLMPLLGFALMGAWALLSWLLGADAPGVALLWCGSPAAVVWAVSLRQALRRSETEDGARKG